MVASLSTLSTLAKSYYLIECIVFRRFYWESKGLLAERGGFRGSLLASSLLSHSRPVRPNGPEAKAVVTFEPRTKNKACPG